MNAKIDDPVLKKILQKYKDLPQPPFQMLYKFSDAHFFDFRNLPDLPWKIEEKLIIGTAPYGVFIDREQNPNQLIEPAEVLPEYIRCIDAGAVAVHTHARTAKSGIYDVDGARKYLQAVVDPLRERYGDRIAFDGGVAYYGKSFEDSLFPIQDGIYEVAIINPSNGLMGDTIRVVHPRVLQAYAEYCKEKNVKIMMDIQDTGDIQNAKRWLVDTGVLTKPYMWHLMGPLYGGYIYMPHVNAMVQGMLAMIERIKEIDENSVIIVSQSGRASSYLVALSIMLGVHVRVGMEDTIWQFPHKPDPIANNYDQVKMAVDIAKYLGRRPATADEYRKMIGVK